MNNYLVIDGKKYSKRTLQVLMGKEEIDNPQNKYLLLAETFDNPYKLPFLLEDICKLEADRSIRLALLRIQIESDLRMNENIQKYACQRYVAQVIEKLLFGELLLVWEEESIEDIHTSPEGED